MDVSASLSRPKIQQLLLAEVSLTYVGLVYVCDLKLELVCDEHLEDQEWMLGSASANRHFVKCEWKLNVLGFVKHVHCLPHITLKDSLNLRLCWNNAATERE